MDGNEPECAPRWRRTVAGLVDMALGGAVAWTLRNRSADPAAAAERMRWLGALPAELVREQLGSPGQRLLGLRTVDRRTGRRVAPWRSLVLFGADIGGKLLAKRAAPPAQTPEQRRERERFGQELRAIHTRHPNDAAAREAEMTRLFEGNPPPPVRVDLSRQMGPQLVAAIVTRGLRRRIAPTHEVLVREEERHSP